MNCTGEVLTIHIVQVDGGTFNFSVVNYFHQNLNTKMV